MQLIALSTLKAYWRRYVAVGLAIAVGAAFLTATLLVQSVTRASLGASIGENYRGADLVMQYRSPESSTDEAQATSDANYGLKETALHFADGTSLVSAAQPIGMALAQLQVEQKDAATTGSSQVMMDNARISFAPTNPEFGAMKITSGAAPVGAGQVAIPQSQADRLKVGIGDSLKLDDTTVTISGLTADSKDPSQNFGVYVWGDMPLLKNIMKDGFFFDEMGLKLAPGVSVASAQSELETLASTQGLKNVRFTTPEVLVKERVANFTGGTDVLTTILLIFAGVALFVMTLVVSNTFSVILAQRTRELGLLRTLGAEQRQVKGLVTMEALLLGVVASILGVALGVGILAALVAWAKTLPGASFTTFSLNPLALWVPVVVGTILTVIASRAPARRATKVTPLEALRPQDVSIEKNELGHRTSLGMSTGMFVYGMVLFVVGTGALIVFSVPVPNLILAFLAGVVSLSGVVVLAPSFIPRSVAALGKLFGTKSAPAQLASLNAVRQPRRTSATGTALVIGVALVTMFLTGGTVAKATLETAIDKQNPVDFSASYFGQESRAYTAEEVAKVRTITGVESAALLQTVAMTVEAGDVLAAPETELKSVLNDASAVPPAGTIGVGSGYVQDNTMQIELPDGTKKTVPVVHSASDYQQPIMTTETAQGLGLAVPIQYTDKSVPAPTTIFARGAANLDANALNQTRDDIASTLGIPPVYVSGSASMRASISGTIDIMLMIVSGLLAVSVLIAVIGVSNTLSLSVIERSQENSLLRALGLTTSQLRSMISRESLLVSLTAAVLGVVLGIFYGLAGARAAMAQFAELITDLPWLMIGVVLVAALLAGLLAAIVPIRRAVKLSPVEGMREAVA